MHAPANQDVPPNSEPEKWWRVHPDVTSRTALSRSKIYALMDAGQLKSVKIGGSRRIPESALREFMARYDGSGEVD